MKLIKRLIIIAAATLTAGTINFTSNKAVEQDVVQIAEVSEVSIIETSAETFATETYFTTPTDVVGFIAPEDNKDTYDNKASYYGNWTDYVDGQTTGITTMSVTEDGEYLRIRITCCFDASKRLICTWDMVGEYDYSENAVYYWNGVCKDNVSYDDGMFQEYIRYTNANGILVFRDGIMHWHEAEEHAGDMCQFVKCA